MLIVLDQVMVQYIVLIILISLEIEYIFLKSAKNYKTSGSVLPKMPHDIIQPFVELDI